MLVTVHQVSAPPQGFLGDSDDSDNYLLSHDTPPATGATGSFPFLAGAIHPAAYADFCQASFAPAFPDFGATFKVGRGGWGSSRGWGVATAWADLRLHRLGNCTLTCSLQGSEESEEDVAPPYGVDGIFGPGVVFTTDLASELTQGDNEWMIAVPDLDSVGRGQPLLSTLRHSSVFESTGTAPLELDVTAGHEPGLDRLNGTADTLQRTLWDEGSAQPSPAPPGLATAAPPSPPSLAVLDDSTDEAMVVAVADSSDSSDEEVSNA